MSAITKAYDALGLTNRGSQRRRQAPLPELLDEEFDEGVSAPILRDALTREVYYGVGGNLGNGNRWVNPSGLPRR
jgi:hypothetical protein